MAWVQEMDGWMDGWMEGWMDGWMDGMAWMVECHRYTT